MILLLPTLQALTVILLTADSCSNNELTNLVAQYNEMRTQISELAEDSGYKGKNLLSATAALRSLAVQFEGTTLDVSGFRRDSGRSGYYSSNMDDRRGDRQIGADIVLLDAALSTMRQNSSSSRRQPEHHHRSSGFLDEHDQHADRRFGQADAGRCQ